MIIINQGLVSGLEIPTALTRLYPALTFFVFAVGVSAPNGKTPDAWKHPEIGCHSDLKQRAYNNHLTRLHPALTHLHPVLRETHALAVAHIKGENKSVNRGEKNNL